LSECAKDLSLLAVQALTSLFGAERSCKKSPAAGKRTGRGMLHRLSGVTMPWARPGRNDGVSTMPPLCLTDEQMSALFAAAHPLPPDSRSAFLEHCARELANLPAIGDGAVHRTVMQVQRIYFDPPHLGTYGKYR
jgi:hypothetical protein